MRHTRCELLMHFRDIQSDKMKCDPDTAREMHLALNNKSSQKMNRKKCEEKNRNTYWRWKKICGKKTASRKYKQDCLHEFVIWHHMLRLRSRTKRLHLEKAKWGNGLLKETQTLAERKHTEFHFECNGLSLRVAWSLRCWEPKIKWQKKSYEKYREEDI